MVEKSICKMKNDKTSDPSSVVTEMLKASSNVCSELIAELTSSIKMWCQVNGMTVLLSAYLKVMVKV